jgi:hypothetical protein
VSKVSDTPSMALMKRHANGAVAATMLR